MVGAYPDIDWYVDGVLKEHNEGIICLSGCLKGEVTEKMLKDDWDGAKEAALRFA